ncbi:hypothetical protein [Verrucomicrobium sp. BvORR034]|jgi:hypothetical protein|uniref:hypothetical protein n=1 Tax=Verrucomicrobium sp. BvORR034 TaxID=1396418 RepID=UPI000678BCA3|nr:hypothetical protein [Verrucomicrobium sp. BvORR034]
MKRLVPFLLALILTPLLVGMSKKVPYSITFHAQASEQDPPKTYFPLDMGAQRMLFKLIPEVSQENVVAFHPFPAENGNAKGIALQLDFRGKGSLEIITRARKGEYLIAMVNGKPTDFVVMDEPVTDGLITIWEGVSDEVIAQMDKKIPRIKPGGPPSMSKNMDMAPVGKRERKDAYEAHKAEEKAKEKARKEGRPTEPEVPSLPAAPTTSRIPVEGADPTPAPTPARPGAPEPYIPPTNPVPTVPTEPLLPRR